MVFDDTNCFPNQSSLIKCRHLQSADPNYNCQTGGGAGIRCSIDRRLKNITHQYWYKAHCHDNLGAKIHFDESATAV